MSLAMPESLDRCDRSSCMFWVDKMGWMFRNNGASDARLQRVSALRCEDMPKKDAIRPSVIPYQQWRDANLIVVAGHSWLAGFMPSQNSNKSRLRLNSHATPEVPIPIRDIGVRTRNSGEIYDPSWKWCLRFNLTPS